MGTYLDFYCSDNNRELKKIVNPILMKQFGWIPQKDYDDFYGKMSDVVFDCEKHFSSEKIKNKNFKSFLTACIRNKIKSQVTYMHRNKRCMKDENGNPIYDISIDAPIDDESNSIFEEYLRSDCNIERELIDTVNSEKIERCLNLLPKIERIILTMLMKGDPIFEIKEKLNISDKKFNEYMESIRENKNILSLNGKDSKKKYKEMEDLEMIENKDMTVKDVMELDTTDSYRMDKNTLGSLLDDMEDELSSTYINCNYITQRQPFLWKEEQINKYYSRILNNQPIPEIVICEQIVNGEKISYLIDGLQRLSYAKVFRKNLIPIKAKGTEFANVKYKKRVVDENGNVKTVEAVFNIIGKYYKDLPEFLQKRFNNFNISITRFFNCTPEMIDYHIRNYNNHVTMNKAQHGITNISNKTATDIKNLSYNHSFFKDNVKTTRKNKKDGSWDEVVARTIMTMNFLEDWKKEIKDIFIYIDKNATDEHYKRLEENLDRLSTVANDTIKNLFTTTNTCIWLTVYDKFRMLGLEDVKFIEFMKAYDETLRYREVNNVVFDNIYKDKNTRDKKIVVAKINGLIALMCGYFDVDKKLTENLEVLKFIKENVSEDTTEEDLAEYLEFYENDLKIEVDNTSRLLENANNSSMLALIAYIMNSSISIGTFKNWLVDFFKRNNTYELNQKRNYNLMVDSLNSYISSDVA